MNAFPQNGRPAKKADASCHFKTITSVFSTNLKKWREYFPHFVVSSSSLRRPCNLSIFRLIKEEPKRRSKCWPNNKKEKMSDVNRKLFPNNISSGRAFNCGVGVSTERGNFGAQLAKVGRPKTKRWVTFELWTSGHLRMSLHNSNQELLITNFSLLTDVHKHNDLFFRLLWHKVGKSFELRAARRWRRKEEKKSAAETNSTRLNDEKLGRTLLLVA